MFVFVSFVWYLILIRLSISFRLYFKPIYVSLYSFSPFFIKLVLFFTFIESYLNFERRKSKNSPRMKTAAQTYGFPHQYSITMLPAVFWLFFDVQKVKKIDPTHTAYIQDARRRGVYGSNMVVVAKKSEKVIYLLKNQKTIFFSQQRVFLM